MICLDTSFIIDFLKKDEEAIKKIIDTEGETLITTEISVFEVLFGIYRMKKTNKKQIEAAFGFFNELPVLSFDHDAAIKSAKIAGELCIKGDIIGSADCQIAGIALVNGCNKIITKNKKHFLKIKELKVEDY